MGYYNNHIHDNWLWFYKFNQVPFASDLYNYTTTNITEIQNYINYTNSLNKSITLLPYHQLLMVLPKESLYKILKELDQVTLDKVNRIFKTESIYLKEMYQDNLFVDLINKEYLWQSKIFFRNFDISFIKLIF